MTWPVVVMILGTVAAFGGIMWWGRAVLRDHPVRAIAVLCVAIIGGFVMWMDWRGSNVLASPDWCGKALQAERITPGNTFVGLTACIDLLKMQLGAVAKDNHTRVLVEAACLLALIVIVVAQGRFAGKTPGGAEIDLGPAEAAAKAADKVATAAVVSAAEVKTDAKLAPTAQPEYNGPGMPEPKGD